MSVYLVEHVEALLNSKWDVKGSENHLVICLGGPKVDNLENGMRVWQVPELSLADKWIDLLLFRVSLGVVHRLGINAISGTLSLFGLKKNSNLISRKCHTLIALLSMKRKSYAITRSFKTLVEQEMEKGVTHRFVQSQTVRMLPTAHKLAKRLPNSLLFLGLARDDELFSVASRPEK